MAMRFSEMLDEYLELRQKGPDESSGYTDKNYYRRLSALRNGMDNLAPGTVEVNLENEKKIVRDDSPSP